MRFQTARTSRFRLRVVMRATLAATVATVALGGGLLLAAYPADTYNPTPTSSNKWCDPGDPPDCRDAHETYAFGSGWPDKVKTAVIAQIDYMNTAAHKGANTPLLAPGPGSTATIVFRYAESDSCGAQALACAIPNRGGKNAEDTASGNYTIYFREDHRAFVNASGGTWYLDWCQLHSNASGCFDARNIALHEIGHFLGLNHWSPDGIGPGADLTVMQTQSRANKAGQSGWNAVNYGSCDMGALQKKYDIDSYSDKYSECLTRQKTVFSDFAASAASIPYHGSVTFTVNFSVADDGDGGNVVPFERNPIADHAVILQRSTDNFATAASYPMTSLGSGDYSLTMGPSGTASWRVIFSTPASEGLTSAKSGTVSVTVRPCTGQCPI